MNSSETVFQCYQFFLLIFFIEHNKIFNFTDTVKNQDVYIEMETNLKYFEPYIN